MKKGIMLKQTVKNNIYACKLLGSASKTRAFHSVILSAVHYFDWLFLFCCVYAVCFECD